VGDKQYRCARQPGSDAANSRINHIATAVMDPRAASTTNSGKIEGFDVGEGAQRRMAGRRGRCGWESGCTGLI